MNQTRLKVNNKGLSLVELIVVIAIMSIAVGSLTLSVSLMTGSEAKKAFQKIESVLDEARTGSMSRFNETLTIKYMEKDTTYSEGTGVSGTIESDGYYGVLTMYALKAVAESGDTDLKHPTVDATGIEVSNKETRKLSNKTPSIAIVCKDAVGTYEFPISDSSSDYIRFEFNRSTGLYSKITVVGTAGTKTINYDSATRRFSIDGGAGNVDVFITAHSGMRKYTMKLIGETGKHVRID